MVYGTWPMRVNNPSRKVAQGTNALASAVILVCRKRPADALVTTRAAFLASLKRELPEALKLLQAGNIAPVDLGPASDRSWYGHLYRGIRRCSKRTTIP